MDEQTLKQLGQMKDFLGKLNGNYITKEEFVKAFQLFKRVLEELKSVNDSVIKETVDTTKKLETNNKELKNSVESSLNKKSIELSSELDKKISEIYSAIESLKESIPEMPEMEEYEDRLEEIKKSIPEIKDTILDTPEQLRDKLETLKGDDRLDKSAIRGLEDELKRIEATRGGGTSFFGGRQMRMVSFAFTGDGVTTDFLLPAVPGAKGLAIWAYYQGQYQQLNTHYTVANKTLSCTGWTPAVDSVLEGYLII